jgi:hypothetical protein
MKTRVRFATTIAAGLFMALIHLPEVRAEQAKPLPETELMTDLIRACAPYAKGALQFSMQYSTVSSFGQPTRNFNEEEARESLIDNVRTALAWSREQLEGDIRFNREELKNSGKAYVSVAWNSCLYKRRIAQLDGKIVTAVRLSAPKSDAQAPVPSPSSDLQITLELTLWNSVVNSNDPAQLNAYLAKYPNGTFAEVARAKIAQINAASQKK